MASRSGEGDAQKSEPASIGPSRVANFPTGSPGEL